MNGSSAFRLVAGGLAAFLLVGCASSARPLGRSPTTPGASALPATSPLTTCVDPLPARPKPIDTAIAGHFADGRIQTPISLDGGAFRALPAQPAEVPNISPALALCNLLAGATANNFSVLEAATSHGMSWGLGVVTISDSVLSPGPRLYLVAGRPATYSLQPYHSRLAWIAVTTPDVRSSCPAMKATSASRQPQAQVPAYQILAIDAETGAAGIVYSSGTNTPCGLSGPAGSGVAPAVEYVSVPWTLSSRGPGPQSATLTYQPRPCDRPVSETFGGTGQPVVLANHTRPGLVSIILERVLTTCGPPRPTPILLRSSTLATNLPPQLIHAPTGAQDVPSEDVP